MDNQVLLTGYSNPDSASSSVLVSLPDVAILRLFQFLDISSLTNLSQTCKYFHKMIKQLFVLSISIPFQVNYLQKISMSGYSRKSVLILRCKKSKNLEGEDPEGDWSFSMSRVIEEQYENHLCYVTDYMVHSQMAFLDFHKLREVDLVPRSLEENKAWLLESRLHSLEGEFTVMESYLHIDNSILDLIRGRGFLCNLTKLCVLVDEWVYIESYMEELTSLLELELTVLTVNNLSEEDYQDYIQSLQSVVSATMAQTLKLIVVQQTEFPYLPMETAFENKFIQILAVEGPCSLCVLPVMENLKELRVKVTTSACPYGPQHRVGLCGVVFEQDRCGVQIVSGNEWKWNHSARS